MQGFKAGLTTPRIKGKVEDIIYPPKGWRERVLKGQVPKTGF